MANLNFELSDINKIESVYPICRYNSLLQINYRFENLLNHKSKFKSIFINDARIIVAEFENNQPFFVSQLTSKHQNLFVLQIQDKCQKINNKKDRFQTCPFY